MVYGAVAGTSIVHGIAWIRVAASERAKVGEGERVRCAILSFLHAC